MGYTPASRPDAHMTIAASVLCPIDFSDPSRGALRYAAAIANHFGARLTLLAVDDPLLAEAAASSGAVASLADETMQELRHVAAETIGTPHGGGPALDFRVRTGKPGIEILAEAREARTDLIVMSSRGQTGIRKMFFGSTAERVLRETPAPVLVTTPDQPPAGTLEEMARHIKRVLAPVDLTPASSRQLTVAAGIAQALSVPLLVAHIVEPVVIPMRVRMAMAGADAARRSAAGDQLAAVTDSIPGAVKTETMILSGDPAEEIVKLTETRRANLIVMGLHSSDISGPRMGSVTYRVLSLSRTLVLALPPHHQHP